MGHKLNVLDLSDWLLVSRFHRLSRKRKNSFCFVFHPCCLFSFISFQYSHFLPLLCISSSLSSLFFFSFFVILFLSPSSLFSLSLLYLPFSLSLCYSLPLSLQYFPPLSLQYFPPLSLFTIPPLSFHYSPLSLHYSLSLSHLYPGYDIKLCLMELLSWSLGNVE